MVTLTITDNRDRCDRRDSRDALLGDVQVLQPTVVDSAWFQV